LSTGGSRCAPVLLEACCGSAASRCRLASSPLTCSCSRRRRVLFMPRRARREGSAAQAARPRPCCRGRPPGPQRAPAGGRKASVGGGRGSVSKPVAHVCQPDEEGKKGALCAQARVGPETLGGASCLKCLRKSRAQFTVTSSLQQPTSTCRVGRLQADPDQQTSEGCCCAEWDGCGGPERRGSGPHGLVCSGCEQHDAVRWPGRAESTGPVVPVVGSCCHACRASLRTP